MQRTDFVEHFTQNLYKYGYEAGEELYKKLPTRYDKIVEVIPLSKANMIKDRRTGNAFVRETSIIGPSTMPIVPAGQVIPTDDPQEGYPVVGAKKKFGLSASVPYELERDWGEAESFIEELVKGEQGWGLANMQAVEDLIVAIFKYAGYTAGADIFDNDISGLTSHTYGSLLYDTIPFAALSGAPHVAKNAATYYNSVATAGTTVTLANLKTLHNLKVVTNAKMENGHVFDNGQKKLILCHPNQEVDWNDIINSDKDPDSANNRSNSLYKAYSVLGLPGLEDVDHFAVGSKNEYSAIKLFLGESEYKFDYVINPPSFEATFLRNFILYVKNFRPWVFANADTA